MSYFDGIVSQDVVYDLLFGAGSVSKIFEDSHYKFMVEFTNGHEVPFTEDGIPGWGSFKKQTLFYKQDIDLTDIDFSPISKVLSEKKIIKLREKNKLQVRVPSGVWRSAKKAEPSYVEKLLENEQYHLFRKKPAKKPKECE